MKTIKILSFLLFFLSSVSMAVAQKMGYTNSAAILVEMPDVKRADSELQTLQTQLENEGEKKAEAFQAAYEKYIQDVQAGLLSAVEDQKRQQQLQQMQQELQAFEQQAYEKLAKRREELYAPILEKLQNAIDAVGKENGYAFIFDVSTLNFILFAEETDDVTPLIKGKLGM